MAQLTDTLVSGDERVTGMIYGTQAGNYAYCTSTASAAKAVTIPGFVLTTGVHVRIKFQYTNQLAVASLTLNVNGTGAKNIKLQGANLPAADVLGQDGIYEFVYDGSYWVLVGGTVSYTNTDTKVKATATTSGTFPILASSTANPNGAATEAVYNTGITMNAGTNTINANISGNAATANAVKTYKYSVTSSTTWRIIAWITSETPAMQSLDANSSVSILIQLHSNETNNTDAGLVKVTIKAGASANTISSVSAKWLYRSSTLSDSAIQVYAQYQGTWAAGIILNGPRTSYTGLYTVLSQYGNWIPVDFSTSDWWVSPSQAASIASLKEFLNLGNSSPTTITVAATDDYVSDTILLDNVPGSTSTSGGTDFRVPGNIICRTMSNITWYVKLSQLAELKTTRFDFRDLTKQRVNLYNDSGISVSVYVPGTGGSVVFDLANQGTYIIDNHTSRTWSTSVWVTKNQSTLYVVYGY